MLNSVLVGKKESKIHVLETREVLSCAVTEVLGSFMALSVGEKVAESLTSLEYMLMSEPLQTGFEKLLEIRWEATSEISALSNSKMIKIKTLIKLILRFLFRKGFIEMAFQIIELKLNSWLMINKLWFITYESSTTDNDLLCRCDPIEFFRFIDFPFVEIRFWNEVYRSTFSLRLILLQKTVLVIVNSQKTFFGFLVFYRVIIFKYRLI